MSDLGSFDERLASRQINLLVAYHGVCWYNRKLPDDIPACFAALYKQPSPLPHAFMSEDEISEMRRKTNYQVDILLQYHKECRQKNVKPALIPECFCASLPCKRARSPPPCEDDRVEREPSVPAPRSHTRTPTWSRSPPPCQDDGVGREPSVPTSRSRYMKTYSYHPSQERSPSPCEDDGVEREPSVPAPRSHMRTPTWSRSPPPCEDEGVGREPSVPTSRSRYMKTYSYHPSQERSQSPCEEGNHL